jgi:hypothetical protein
MVAKDSRDERRVRVRTEELREIEAELIPGVKTSESTGERNSSRGESRNESRGERRGENSGDKMG